MISAKFQQSIHNLAEIACHLQIFPFKYHKSCRRLEKKKWYENLGFLLHVYLVKLYVFYLIVRMAFSTSYLEKHMAEFSIYIFRLIFIFDTLTFQKNIRKKKMEMAWLFNQVTSINENMKEVPINCSMIEKIMMTWPMGHFTMFLTYVLSFLLNPTEIQYIYSLLPAEWHNTGTFGLFIIFEIIVWYDSMGCEAVELYMQTLSLQSFIGWTKLTTKVATSLEDLENKIVKYRITAILLENFTYCYGGMIEQLKMTVTIALVFINYCLLKKHHELNIFTFAMLMSSCLIGHFLPPLMYNFGYEVHENALATKRGMTFALSKIHDSAMRHVYRLEIQSLRPLTVKVAGLYFLDRTMTPLFYQIITSYTVSFLIMF